MVVADDDSTPEEIGRPRVLSLLSAATEVVWRLGMGDALVGRSHECDWPSAVLRLPQVSTPRIDPSASAKDIDRRREGVLGGARAGVRPRRGGCGHAEPDGGHCPEPLPRVRGDAR